MSLMLGYLVFVIYVMSSYVELELLFLYTYIGILIISPLKAAYVSNTSPGLIESEKYFFKLLIRSLPFFLIYLVQYYLYGNFQITRFMFDFSGAFSWAPEYIQDIFEFYTTSLISLDDPIWNPLLALLMDVFIIIMFVLFFIPAVVIVIVGMIIHMIWMLVTVGFSLLVNGSILLIVLGSMIWPILYANKQNGSRKDVPRYVSFLRVYIEISVILIFFILVAV